jgi:hypothetical protein
VSTETIIQGLEAAKRFAVEVVYNGISRVVEVQPHEQVTALLAKSIATFNIAQNPHLLSLYRQDGSLVPENGSVQDAGIVADEVLLLRQNTVKGGAATIRLSDGVVRRSFEVLRECGRSGNECVVYWIGPSTDSVVDVIEHPLHRRSPFGYEVDDKWLTNFFLGLAKSKRSVKAQVHTHPGAAFHSHTDDYWPVISQVGFISVVIPFFATGVQSLNDAWIGQLGKNGWTELNSAAEAFIQ